MVFWGGLAPRDHPTFTSDFNKDFESYPKTVNYTMYSELIRIMLILLSVIFNHMAAQQDDPALMQLCHAIRDRRKQQGPVVSNCVNHKRCTTVSKRRGWKETL